MPMERAAMEMRPPSRDLEAIDKTVIGGAEQLSAGQAAVFENHFAGGAGSQAKLVFLLAEAEAGGVFVDQKRGDAVLGGGAVGDGHGDADIGIVGVGGESFGAVEEPGIAITLSVGAGAGGVRTGFGFGERPAAEPFARGQFGQVVAALRVTAHFEDVVGAERGCERPE